MKIPILVVVLCASLSAAGQPFAEGKDRRFSAERIELLRMWKMVDELEIDEEQAASLFPMWSQHNRDMKEIRVSRKAATQELETLVADVQAGEAKILKAMEMVEKLDSERGATQKRFDERLKGLLSVRQRAKLLLFSGRFRRDLREIVEGFREMRGPEPGGRRGRGPGGRWDHQD